MINATYRQRAEGEIQRLVLAGEATVGSAAELHRQLCQMPPCDEIEVDLSGLEALDVTGTQVLVAWRRHLGADRVRFLACPASIADFLRGCGLDRHLLE